MSPPHPGQDALAINYIKSEPDQFIAFEVIVDCDFSQFGRIQMWVARDITLQLELEDGDANSIELASATSTNPDGWSQLEFDYAGAGDRIDLTDIRLVKIYPAPGDPEAQGRFVLDEIYLVP